MKNYFIICLLLLGLALQSCKDVGDSELKAKFIDEMLVCKKENRIFCISQITDFDWERVCMIYGQNDGWREEQVSGQICANAFAVGPHERYVFFLKGREIVKFFLVDNRKDVAFFMYDPPSEYELEDCLNEFATPRNARYKVRQEKGGFGFGEELVLIPQ